MMSNNSGFQRLAQAALSRSRFLRLAAGALLPFVGSRLSAAAAPNPELAQNSGAPGTKDAAAAGRMGAILVSQFGLVKLHSYLSPADGFQVNTQMIEGPTAVVIFDGQLLLPYADEVASYAQTLGKPVDRIILSHAHTDHWSGLQVTSSARGHGANSPFASSTRREGRCMTVILAKRTQLRFWPNEANNSGRPRASGDPGSPAGVHGSRLSARLRGCRPGRQPVGWRDGAWLILAK
jgi:hypothetical protein